METATSDPTAPIRRKAARYTGAVEGTSCTQTSFKVGKKAFLYVGPQGDRFKAMFRLRESMDDAQKLAKAEPDRFETGSTGWVTARFSAETPMPKRLWEKWLDESYELSSSSAEPRAKKAATKKR